MWIHVADPTRWVPSAHPLDKYIFFLFGFLWHSRVFILQVLIDTKKYLIEVSLVHGFLAREAKRRSTSIYLPTGTIPMFPMDLAGGSMSLRQGYDCCAVSVSVIFHLDGR